MALTQVVIGLAGFLFPRSSSFGFLNIVIMVLATIGAGRRFGMAAGRLPSIEERFAFGVIVTLGSLVINLIYLAVLLSHFGFDVSGANILAALNGGEVRPDQVASRVLEYLALSVLIGVAISVMGFGIGARRALR